VKLIVLNNSALAFVELEMKASGFVPFATELKNPNFARIAEASHLLGIKVERPEQVRESLVQAFEHNGPALVEVRVNRQELSLPPSIELKQALGFNLYLLRAMLNGRADEVIDLAKTNLWR
jgi:pyruvate dehydrogenase (quinone)